MLFSWQSPFSGQAFLARQLHALSLETMESFVIFELCDFTNFLHVVHATVAYLHSVFVEYFVKLARFTKMFVNQV